MLRFGKHKGMHIIEVKMKDPNYLQWLIAQPWFKERNQHLIETLENKNPVCEVCEKPLVPIGSSRENGADHDDWVGRRLHKKCWVLKEWEP